MNARYTETAAHPSRESVLSAMHGEGARQEPSREEAWLRHFEKVRLGGDAFEIAALSLSAARRSLDGDDAEQALTHLNRVERVLGGVPVQWRTLSLQADLAELTGDVARALRQSPLLEDPMQARQLGELARDRCYAVTALLDRLHDHGARVTLRLRVADLLEAAGDVADASAMRARAAR